MLAPGRIWRTAYEVDFTTLPNQDLKAGGDGAKNIDGKTWTLGNSGNAASVDVVNGVGIRFVANANDANYFNNIRSLPVLTLPILSALASYSIQNQVVRVLVRTVTAPDANFEAAKIGIEDSSQPLAENMQAAKLFSGSAVKIEAISTVSSTSSPRFSSTVDNNHDVLGVVFEAPSSWEMWSGLYDGNEYVNMRLLTARFSERLSMATPPLFLNTQPRIFMGMQTANTLGDFEVVYSHLRIDHYIKNPAGLLF